MKTIFLFFLMLLMTTMSKAEQGNYEAADPEIAELAQYEYMRGEWEVTIHVAEEDGTFRQTENKATVRGFFLPDGRSFQTIFSTSDGALTTDIRSFNVKTKKWQILFLNAKAQRWHQFEAYMINGVMQTIVPGGYSGNEDFDIKIIDRRITDQGFTKDVYRREKGSDVWAHIYIMDYIKRPAI